MWCRSARAQMSAYVDGELATAEASAVEEHLARCGRCAQEHQALRQVARLTGLVPEEALPSGLEARILMRLAYAETEAQPATRPRRMTARASWMYPALTGAAAALALGVVVARSESARQPERSAAEPSRGIRTAERPAQRAPAGEPSTPETAVSEAAVSGADAPVMKKAAVRRAVAVRPQLRRPRAERKAVLARREEGKSERPVPAAPRMVAATPKVEPTARREGSVRRVGMSPVVRTVRPQPLAAPFSGRPVSEIRATEPDAPITAGQPPIVAMPGDPVINSTGPGAPAPVMAATDREGTTRVAGMMGDAAPAAPEDEGLENLRNFFEERSRVVPQPPPYPARERRMRRSL